MTNDLRLKASTYAWEQHLTKPSHEDGASYRAWLAKGDDQDRRSNSARVKAVAVVSIAVLLATAALWSRLIPYEIAVRFVVTVGAISLMINATHLHYYASLVVFGALVLIFNPILPLFAISGDWQRALAIASIVPFAVSLTWRKAWPALDDQLPGR